MSSRSAELHAWQSPVNERWISAAISIEHAHATLERQGRRATNTKPGPMAQASMTVTHHATHQSPMSRLITLWS
jgi:hypothetical protein